MYFHFQFKNAMYESSLKEVRQICRRVEDAEVGFEALGSRHYLILKSRVNNKSIPGRDTAQVVLENGETASQKQFKISF